MHIAIIDRLGLPYDDNTLTKRGLGGSESAVIYMARELVTLGFRVTVFNSHYHENTAQLGRLCYRHWREVPLYQGGCDIFISSRSVAPFTDDLYATLRNSAKYKVLWMHDTFCEGDDQLEALVVAKKIDTIFTLSDFHTSYVTNCQHGPRRNFEVLKNHIFMTRNGVKRYYPTQPIEKKDQHLFVYNASASKGMVPLVQHIWPRVKRRLPDAQLAIIGGFYEFPDKKPDEQQLTWERLCRRPENLSQHIVFTGVIRQSSVAKIVANAKFMIYPAEFPETFGISTLEALTYNTPVITNRFGALEETAFDLACYKMNYPIAPNSLFPHIDAETQYDKFADMVVAAASDDYLYEQKYNMCSVIGDICDWSTIALQWKQHFYRRMQRYLPVEEYRQVMHINHRVAEVFGRRFSNPEDRVYPTKPETTRFIVVSPLYNAEKYVEDCILSVASQDYENYLHIVIDDASTDGTADAILQAFATLTQARREKLVILRRETNMGSVYNYVKTVQDSYVGKDGVVVMLDGDDALMPDPHIFSKLNHLYLNGAEMTYGSMWSMADNIPLVAQDYPQEVKDAKKYREHLFRWNMPYTHLRTFSARLLKDVPESAFQIDGKWMRAGGDTAIFYSVIERADPNKVIAVKDIWYRYNDKNPINDYKVNAQEQTATANTVLQRKKRILLAIPTAKYIEPETFRSIYNLVVPDGYLLDFEFFYGYQIDQIRNLIANTVVRNNYDYLFSVDSDIVVPENALIEMLREDLDIVSGVYVQRTDANTPEVFRKRQPPEIGMRHLDLAELTPDALIPVDACGFGCVLVKREVFESVGYPYFTYHSAIDHNHTLSEDVDFCMKATAKGFKIFCDTLIRCSHKGTRWHLVP